MQHIILTKKKPCYEKTCLCHILYANNKGADQAAHLHSTISIVVVCFLDSIMPVVSISKISSCCLASLAVRAGLSLPWLETPKTGSQEVQVTHHCVQER